MDRTTVRTGAAAASADFEVLGVPRGFYRSWLADHPVQSGGQTIADGLAVDRPEQITVDLLTALLPRR